MRVRSTLDWSQYKMFLVKNLSFDLLNSRSLHWLPKWQDRCYRASRELCSDYLFMLFYSCGCHLRQLSRRSQFYASLCMLSI